MNLRIGERISKALLSVIVCMIYVIIFALVSCLFVFIPFIALFWPDVVKISKSGGISLFN